MARSWRARLVVGIVLTTAALGAGILTARAAPPDFEWNVMLRGWHVAGPIAKQDRGKGELDRKLAPGEPSLKPGEQIAVDGQSYEWRQCDGPMIDFLRTLDAEGDAGQHALAYAWTEFTSEKAQEAILAISHDDGVVVWLNGEEIHRDDAQVASKLDQAAIKVSLKKGTNTLLAKVSQGTGAWELAARLRPPGMDEPLITLSGDGSAGGDMARLPTLELELLGADGSRTDTWRTSGGRVGSPFVIQYTIYAAEPDPAPEKVRVRYDAPGFAAFDKTYDWSEVRGGTVSLPLVAAAPIRGRAIDANSGKPVAGAEIRWGEKPLNEPSGEDGRFQLDADDPLVDFVTVLAAGYEPKQTRVAWPPNDDWTVKLAPGGHVVRGRVLTDDGKPLAGAVFSANIGRRVEVASDDEGRLEVIGIPGTRETLYPTVSHPDYVAKDGFNMPLDADGVTEVEWRLEPGATVTGCVTAKDDGRPLEGITVTSGSDRFVSNRVNPKATTDAEGRYRLSGIKPGVVLIHVFSDHFAPAMQKGATVVGTPARADFQIEPGQAVTGRVTDPDGNPLASVWIVTDTWNNARMFRREDRTDADGRFELPHMPAEPVETDILKQGYVSKRDNQFVAGEHYEITLAPVVEHTIRLRLAGSAEPPAEVTIQKGYQWPGRSETSWTDVASYDNDAKYDATAGVVRIRVDEPTTAKLSWRLRVPGYRDVTIDHPEIGAEPQALEYTLEKIQTTVGRVVSASTAAPLEGVMVALATKQDRLRLDHFVHYKDGFGAADRFTGVQATTAADGSFELPSLAEDDDGSRVDLVLLRKEGGFHYIPDARSVLAAGNVELPFPEAGAIEGRVIVAGQPVGGAEVHLAWIAPASDADQWDLPFGFGGQVTAGSDGSFRYAGLGPGRYRISRIRSFKNPLGGGSMSSHLTGEEIIVLPGEKVTHEFNQPAGHTVTGQAVGTQGEPLPNCLVSVNKASDPTGRVDAVLSDAEGRFTIEHLQPGSYGLSADQYEMTASGCGLGEQGPHGTATVKVEGDTTVRIKLAPRTRSQVARAGTGAAATLVGSVPPDFTGKLFGRDDTFTLADHFGKVVAIDFWATWCGPCMAVMPEMKQLHEKYKDSDDVVFITISLDQDADALRSVMEEQGIEFPVIYESREASQAIASAFGVSGIPSSFVIGRNGRFASERIHGSQLLATTDEAVKQPLDPAFAQAGKPARLTVKLSLDDEPGLPGASIALQAADAAGNTVIEETIHPPGQAAQFTWLYPPLEEGGSVQVKVEAAGLAAQEKSVDSPAETAEIAFAFASPRAIAGRIAVEGKTPVPKATVTAQRNDGFRRSTQTDDDGEFAMKVMPGTYTLSFAGTDDFAPISGEREQVEVTADADPESLELAACPTVAVTGTVTDEEGEPVEGAQVRTAASGTGVTTDEQGRFTLAGLPSQGSVQLYAIKRPLYAVVTLEDFDGSEPQELVLGQQAGRSGTLAPGTKAPSLTLYELADGEPAEWQQGEEETLVVFAALWHPEARRLLEQARTWAEEHRAAFVPVSIDWSLEQARREADELNRDPAAPFGSARPGRGPYEIRFAGPGGLAVAKDWALKSSAQAYLLSAEGKIRRVPPPGQLP